MGTIHHPRRGSLGYRPKCRARRIYPKIKSRINSKEAKIAEFAGYKVGMTHATITNLRKGSTTFGQEVSVPVTVIECPAIKIIGIRTYSKKFLGYAVLNEAWIEKLDKNSERTIIKMKRNTKAGDIRKNIQDIAKVRLIAQSVPSATNTGKKKPEIFEIEVLGENTEEKLKIAEGKLGNEIKASEIFKIGDYVDAIGVTKGKGKQGSVKRFGVKILSHKSQKILRKIATLGPWHPHRTRWTVAQFGQLGFFNRVELNKRILKIGPSEEIKMNGGWLNYGPVQNEYMLIKGSVPGAAKRLIFLRAAVRISSRKEDVSVSKVSLQSKQGS